MLGLQAASARSLAKDTYIDRGGTVPLAGLRLRPCQMTVLSLDMAAPCGHPPVADQVWKKGALAISDWVIGCVPSGRFA